MHLILVQPNTDAMFTQPLNSNEILNSYCRIALTITILLLSYSAFGQENPWEPKKGNNPWGTEVPSGQKNETITPSREKTVEEKEDSIIAPPAKKADVPNVLSEANDLVYLEEYKSYFYKVPNFQYYGYSREIKDTLFLRTNNGYKLILDRNDEHVLEHLENYSEIQYKAPGAFIGSFLTASILNFFCVPINAISLTVPTYRKGKLVSDFERDNKGATESETKSIKRGIQNKRTQNTGGGTLAGIVTSFIIWFNVFN